MIRNYFKFLLLSFSIFVTACSSPISVNVDKENIESTLSALLQESMEDSFSSSKGISLSVISNSLGINWHQSIGYISKKETDTLLIDNPFRIASVTKTFVAISILRLHELDSISIEDNISKYISEDHKHVLIQGGYNPADIKIKHCLNHTSGLFDYAMDGGKYIDAVTTDPKRIWTRTDQLKFAMNNGSKYGYPGERYNYSDTGYILLGEILENITGRNLGQAIRALCRFSEFDMPNTWLEYIEKAPSNHKQFVSRYLGKTDATNYHASIDLYGGGGLISTTKDLCIFFDALFTNKIFEKEETLKLLLTKPIYDPKYNTNVDQRFKDYRYGIWSNDIFNLKVYTHGGLWGTRFFSIPELNSTIIYNNTVGHNERLAKKVIGLLKNQIDNK